MPEEFSTSLGELTKQGILQLGDGYRTKRSELGLTGVPILRVAEVLDGRIDPTFTDYIREEFRPAFNKKASAPGDILVTTKGTVGRIARVRKSDPQFVYSPQLCFFRVLDESLIDPRWLYQWFRSTEFMTQAAKVQHQTDMAPYINLADLRAMRISIPSMHQQRGISEALEAFDEKIINNERMASLSSELSALHFSEALAQGPHEMCRVEDVAEVFDGPHATPQKTLDGPWFLSISSLRSGRMDLNKSAHLSEEDFAKWTRRVRPVAGDLLFSYETRLGEAALMPDGIRACLGRRMGLLRPKRDSIAPVVLLHTYLGAEFQELIHRRKISGATVERISLKELPNWPIKVPVRNGTRRLAELLGTLHTQVVAAESESRRLALLRDALASKLMSGQIIVREADKVMEGAL
ncbi:restriction endonuclease subunit S [Streptomyces sp. NPDC096080]|uniref:restriction endonuclease subunit S n=1 Tax=Streptomyces sp. NPDC096080 TaxID=3156693 RepID=UPI00331E40B8